jgi:hypothetical protein
VSWLEVLVVIGIIGFVIYQQLAGQLPQGRRLVVLPAVVTVIGFLALRGHQMGTRAHVAASTTPLLFTLGLNRLGQAAVIVSRAMRAGIPFAAEKDGRTFLGGSFGGHDRDASGRY